MCSDMESPSGSRSGLMHFLERFPRSQGETLAHEVRKTRGARRSRNFIGLFEGCFDLSFEGLDRFLSMESGVDVNDAAIFSDKIGSGHSLRADFRNEFLSVIQDDGEGVVEPS